MKSSFSNLKEASWRVAWGWSQSIRNRCILHMVNVFNSGWGERVATQLFLWSIGSDQIQTVFNSIPLIYMVPIQNIRSCGGDRRKGTWPVSIGVFLQLGQQTGRGGLWFVSVISQPNGFREWKANIGLTEIIAVTSHHTLLKASSHTHKHPHTHTHCTSGQTRQNWPVWQGVFLED